MTIARSSPCLTLQKEKKKDIGRSAGWLCGKIILVIIDVRKRNRNQNQKEKEAKAEKKGRKGRKKSE